MLLASRRLPERTRPRAKVRVQFERRPGKLIVETSTPAPPRTFPLAIVTPSPSSTAPWGLMIAGMVTELLIPAPPQRPSDVPAPDAGSGATTLDLDQETTVGVSAAAVLGLPGTEPRVGAWGSRPPCRSV